MHVQVLGSAAGGGFPQWNCSCPNCIGIRQKPEDFQARTQSSIAVSSDQKNWVVINCSPDIRQQINLFSPLQAQNVRSTGITGVILVDSQIDHTAGLLILREGDTLPIYSTEAVREDLSTSYPIFNLLKSYCGIDWTEIKLNRDGFRVAGIKNIEFKALQLTNHASPYSSHCDEPVIGNNIALQVTDCNTGHSLFYAPGLGGIAAETRMAMSTANVLLVDGTFWTNDEMQIVGKAKTAHEMGHLPMSGEGGMLELLDNFAQARKILIHINNTNPMLNIKSPQHAQVLERGIEISFDGMSIEV